MNEGMNEDVKKGDMDGDEKVEEKRLMERRLMTRARFSALFKNGSARTVDNNATEILVIPIQNDGESR